MPTKQPNNELPLDAKVIEVETKVTDPPKAEVPATTTNVMDILQVATGKLGGESSKDIAEAIKTLVQLQNSQEDRNAARWFYEDLSKAQSEFPIIPKNKKADFATNQGGNVKYSYAELDKIDQAVKPTLKKYGFSVNWNTTTVDKKMTVVCFLHHKSGHQEQASLESPVPDSIARMNVIQTQGAVQTALMRRTLVSVLGITSTEEDTDGNPEQLSLPISEKLADEILARIAKYDRTVQQFCEMMKVEKIADLTRGDIPKVNQVFQGMKAKVQ